MNGGAKEQLADIYDKLLGGGSMPPEGPLPEAADFEEALAATEEAAQPDPCVAGNRASLGGHGVVLNPEDREAIITIVAKAIARDAEAQLESWRAKYALHKKE